MNINWDELRKEQFPALENSIYLKAAGGSPMCKTAYQEVLKYFYELILGYFPSRSSPFRPQRF